MKRWKKPWMQLEMRQANKHWNIPCRFLSNHLNGKTRSVTTLALGSQPRQGVARLRAKRETRESFHMLPRVQRVWGNEPSHSQVNSHVGSWSPERTPEFSKCDRKCQNSLAWGVLYINGNLLKRRCLKWARIAHLDICNTSYGQKNGQESNW
jgi:hypothetical protein